MGLQYIEQFNFGVYVARTEDGRYIKDQNGNYLCIQSRKGDAKKLKELADAAKHYGFEHIKVDFRDGARLIDDEEYEEQMARAKMGLVPDKYDLGVAADEYRKGRAK